MNRIYKYLNNIQTLLLTWGDPFNSKPQDVIICITGNPGISDFYIEFASEIHKVMSTPVCVIGHAGHDNEVDSNGSLNKNANLYNLQGQLKHKLDLLENHIDKDCKIHLIGHSIGAWMIVELLHQNEYLLTRVSSINLLFPTLQRMAESKNGIFINSFLRKMETFVFFLIKLLYFVPNFLINFLVMVYLYVKFLPSTYFLRIKKIVNSKVIEKVLFLAFDEMDKVLALNYDGMNKIKHLTNVIYSNIDGWAPVEFMEDLNIFKPHLELRNVDNIEHAFVLKSSELVAQMVIEHIKCKKARQTLTS